VAAAGGEEQAAVRSGLTGSLRQLASSLAATLHSRVELFALEIGRERDRAVRLVVIAVAGLFFFMLAAFTATVLVIIVFWDSHRIAAAGTLFLIDLVAGLLLLKLARKEAAKAARPFESTREQLRQDRDALR
jgi:uncharacterized membrane protein YqjE